MLEGTMAKISDMVKTSSSFGGMRDLFEKAIESGNKSKTCSPSHQPQNEFEEKIVSSGDIFKNNDFVFMSYSSYNNLPPRARHIIDTKLKPLRLGGVVFSYKLFCEYEESIVKEFMPDTVMILTYDKKDQFQLIVNTDGYSDANNLSDRALKYYREGLESKIYKTYGLPASGSLPVIRKIHNLEDLVG